MTCDMECQCGNLKGTAQVGIANPGVKPVLIYSMSAGPFTIGQRGLDQGLLICNVCEKPALTVGNWR